MSRLRVAIVDDEPLARTRLRRLLAADPAVEIVADCDSAAALADVLREQRRDAQLLDAVFLDIEMPESDGFAALRALPAPRPAVVFVTAYSAHAVRAFDVAAVDYLVKPVSQERLLAAVARVRAHRTAVADAPAPATPFPERLALPIGRRMSLVAVDTIDRVLALANYLEVRVGPRAYVLRRPLGWLEPQLDPRRFVRVHRSHIVRIDAVSQIEPQASGRYCLTLRDGARLFSGRSHRERIRAAFGLLDPAD